MIDERDGLKPPEDALSEAREAACKAIKELGDLNKLLGPDVDTDAVVFEAEHAAAEQIRNHLLDQFADHSLFFEEDCVHRGESQYTWIVDPLDGTDSFRNRGSEYAVSIALYADEFPILGVVTTPEAAHCPTFAAVVDESATCDGDQIEISPIDQPAHATLASGYDRGGRFLRKTATLVENQYRCSSAALNLCELARGEIEGHWEFDAYPWDVAAGVVIARAAGATITDEEGERFEPGLRPTDSRKPLLASNGAFHDRLLDIASQLEG